jgi:ABC-2 type transport system ATP-binding protein
MSSMLEVRNVTRRFAAITAVDGVSLRAGTGETVGLLGPNGAGKTTTVSLIAGLLRPDSGEVLVDGRRLGGDTDPLKRRIGLVTQELALVDELSAANNLRLFAALYDLDRRTARRAIDEALTLVGLTDRAGDLVGTFSGGMKRRLNLAAALLHDPQVLLLDEPTVGVDPQSRHAIFDNLAALRQRGKTLVYTTHYMEEAERLCDRIVIMDHGRVVADDTVQGLARLVPYESVIAIEFEENAALAPEDGLRALPGVNRVAAAPGTLRVAVSRLSDALPAVLAWCAANGLGLRHVSTERASLETVFLALTGRSLRD